MTLTLYKFGPQWGLTDPSPFCMKLESFLRLNDINFKYGGRDIRKSLKNAPKQKLPFVVFENGDQMGDSNLIIKRLSAERGIDMNAALTAEQRGIAHAYCRMLDEATYFTALYARWIDEPGWSVMKDTFFSALPALLRGYICAKIQKDKIKHLDMQGIGRHSKEDIYAFAQADMDALSALLGDKTWFFGADTPTLLDIWAHAFVIQTIVPPIDMPLKTHTLSLQNLCDHAHRFQELVYKK